MPTSDVLSGDWTYEKYYALEDEQRYEVIAGELLVVPAPGTFHQSIAGEFFIRLTAFVREHDAGQVFISPVDVVLNETNVVQPDVVFIQKARRGIIDARAIHGAPDLVVEVLSPGTRRRDRTIKTALYANAGVLECWVLDPRARSIEVLVLEKNGFEPFSHATAQGAAKSRLLDGFALEVEDVIPAGLLR
jgi:Uma2 family endonuclease